MKLAGSPPARRVRLLFMLALPLRLALFPHSALSQAAPSATGDAAALAWTQSEPSLAAAQAAFSRRDWKAASTLSAAVAASSASSPAQHASALRLGAKADINRSDFASAEGRLQALVALEPANPEVLYLLGFTLERENKPRESLEVFTRAAALQTPTAEDLKVVGLDYVLLDDYVDAVHWLQRSVAMGPRDAEAWYDLGRAEMHEGQFPAAEASFRHTLSLEPGHVKAMDNLGLSLEAQNRPEEALAAYQAAIQAQAKPSPGVPTHPNEQPSLNLGALLNTRSAFAEAAQVLAHATEVAPRNAKCWEELARAEVGLGRNQDARVHMQRAIDLDSSNPRLHYQLGRIYRSLAMGPEADAEFSRSSALYGSRSSAPQP